MSTLDRTLAVGDPPLTPRLEPWMEELCGDRERVQRLLDENGSPVHLHRVAPFLDNARRLQDVAAAEGVDFDLHFARKASKALCYVEAAAKAGFGADVAGDQELRRSLEVGMPPERIVVTAAVKPRPLLERAVAAGVTVVLDNADEIDKLAAVAREQGRSVPVALRLNGFETPEGRLESRFGFPVDDASVVIRRLGYADLKPLLELRGLQFHLDGYDAAERVAALDGCLSLVDQVREEGVELTTIDMGGGFPMAYLDPETGDDEWRGFRRELDRALLGQREAVTYRNTGFGRLRHGDELVGDSAAYPHWQDPVAAEWLAAVLRAPRPSRPSETVAQAFRNRGLRLAAEPGRALLDGCGLTLARVEHTKMLRSGDLLVGLAMNGSNCRTKKSELLVDPLMIPRSEDPRGPCRRSGYLTGAYCTESDLITSRKLAFPRGVEIGDVFAFPNTAGYYMHFTESRSHQFPLPENVVLES